MKAEGATDSLIASRQPSRHLLLRWWLIALVLLEILIRTPLRWFSLIGVLNLVQPFWYAPVVPFMLVAMLRRRWRMIALGGVIALIWLGQYAPRWFTHASDQPAQLRVMTWNVAGWNLNINDVARAIDAEQPDLFVLQEVDEGLRRPLIAHFAARYPFYEIRLPTEAGLQPADLVIFSRFPYQTSALDCPYWECYRRAVDVDVRGTSVTVINVHIEHSPVLAQKIFDMRIPYGVADWREQAAIKRLLDDTANWGKPLLILGDFNTADRQRGYDLLAQRWGDTWRERGRGMGMTWTAWRGVMPPMLRIDYIWHSGEFEPLRIHTGQGISDHRYLLADFGLNRE